MFSCPVCLPLPPPSRLLRLIACLLLVSATGARAGTPDPATSTMEPAIVGTPHGTSGYEFDVTVRDINYLPVSGSVVKVSFVGSGLRLHSTQQSGTTLDCVNQSLSRTTSVLGTVAFIARFCGYVDSDQIQVTASDVLLGSIKGRSPDYDANGRIGLTDFVMFSDDYLDHQERQRSDFDLSGSVSLRDFVLWSFEATNYDEWDAPVPLCP